MRIREFTRAAILSAGLGIGLSACGGPRQPAAYPAGPPSAAVEEMKVPDSPYYVIYHPPVSLAKPTIR